MLNLLFHTDPAWQPKWTKPWPLRHPRAKWKQHSPVLNQTKTTHMFLKISVFVSNYMSNTYFSHLPSLLLQFGLKWNAQDVHTACTEYGSQKNSSSACLQLRDKNQTKTKTNQMNRLSNKLRLKDFSKTCSAPLCTQQRCVGVHFAVDILSSNGVRGSLFRSTHSMKSSFSLCLFSFLSYCEPLGTWEKKNPEWEL